jgi:hypothetical protein
MSSQINTPIGIPSELNFGLPSSMLPSRKFELRVQPYGQSTFNTAGQALRVVLPQMQRTLYNFQTAYLMGTISFTHAGLAGTDMSYLLGSWYSLFSRQVVRAGSGYVLETIDNPGQLVNAITSMTMSAPERASLNNTFGFSNLATNNNLGVKINADTAATDIGGATGDEKNFSFAIPLIGILNNSKLFPAWVGDMEIELTLADISRFIASITANSVTAFTLNNVEFVTECLELSPESYNMVMAQNPDKVVLKTQTYTYGSSSLPASQGAGSVDIPFQIKVNSMKQLIWYAQPSDAIEKTYSGVNPNLENWQFIVNGISYPQRPVQAKYPSEAFMQNQKSFGSVYSTSHPGGATRNEFNTASTAYNLYHRPYFAATLSGGILLYQNIETRANKWFQCLDLETINSNKESLYSGISTNGTTSTLRLNIAATLAAQVHNIHYWSCQDVMVVMDLMSGITSVVV